jgi:hypothetical protein
MKRKRITKKNTLQLFPTPILNVSYMKTVIKTMGNNFFFYSF